MRPVKFIAISALAIAAMPLFSAPSMAADAEAIQFVPGTGQAVMAAAPMATPAKSFTATDSAGEMNDMAAKMADPRMQDNVAHMVESMTGAMMRLPIGQMAAAVEKARPGTLHKRIRSDATLADLAGRDARDLPETLGEKSRDMMGMMGGFAKAFAVMLPEFEKMGKEMAASLDEAKVNSR